MIYKRILLAVAIAITVAANAVAGPACDDIPYTCPGSLCYAQQIFCQNEREFEARIRNLKEAEEATVAEKKRNAEAANEERRKREHMNLKSENSSSTPASLSVSAPGKKGTTKTSRQKSSLPANAKWNAPPELGWSCLGAYHQEDLDCVKDK